MALAKTDDGAPEVGRNQKVTTTIGAILALVVIASQATMLYSDTTSKIADASERATQVAERVAEQNAEIVAQNVKIEKNLAAIARIEGKLDAIIELLQENKPQKRRTNE